LSAAAFIRYARRWHWSPAAKEQLPEEIKKVATSGLDIRADPASR
jgi:hypothetical protein